MNAPKRPPMSKAATLKRKAATQSSGGGCATCSKIRGALLRAASLVMPRR